jgi:Immunity protein 7
MILPTVEFQGWFVLPEADLAPLRAKVEALDWRDTTANLCAYDGSPTLMIEGRVERLRSEYYDAEALIAWVGEHVPGSHGSLWRRGEEPTEVLVMRGGRIVANRDPFSATVPALEEPVPDYL